MTKTDDKRAPKMHISYECPSCPVDMSQPGTCDTCGRPLLRREYSR